MTFLPAFPRFLIAFLWTVSVALAAEKSSSSSWPQFRGPNRDNHSPDTGVNLDWRTKAPSLLWKVEGMGEGYASVAVVGNRLYTTGNTPDGQSVIAVDLNRQVAWRTPITDSSPKHGYPGSRCTPTVDGEYVYAISSDGRIACLSAADGKILWSRKFSEWNGKMMSSWGFSESPLVDGDHVLCTPGSDEAMIVCLNKLTGAEVWKSIVPDFGDAGKKGAGYATMAISNAGGVKQYVQLVGRGAIGVRASNGELLWTYNRVANTTANIPTPIVDGDYVFTSSGYKDGGTALLHLSKQGNGVAVEEKFYKPASELQNHHGGMVLHKGHIYMGHGHNKGFPTCVNARTGDVLWGLKLRGPGNDSAAVTFVDNHMIFRYQSGEVCVIEATPEEYRMKGFFKPEVMIKEGWSHPVVCQKKLFLREQDWLMVYDLAN